MALIQRSISVPDNKAIFGYTSNGVGNQSTLNAFIKDVHTALVDSGLTHLSSIPDSLDVNNIPDKNYGQYFNVANLGYYEFKPVGSIYYAFNDDEQEENPVYFKFEPGMLNVSPTGYANLLVVSIRLTILRSLSPEDPIYPSHNLAFVYQGINGSSYIPNYYNSTHKSNMITCFYNRKNFYLNIFPQSKVIGPAYSSNTSYNFSTSKFSSYISYYFERKNNACIFLPLSVGYAHNSGTNSNIQSLPVTQRINNVKNDATILDTNETLLLPMVNVVDTLNNNYSEGGINPLGFKSIRYDKSRKTIEPSDTILLGYTSQIGQTNVKYEIELDQNVKGKYISFSCFDNLAFFNNTKTDYLFRYE